MNTWKKKETNLLWIITIKNMKNFIYDHNIMKFTYFSNDN